MPADLDRPWRAGSNLDISRTCLHAQVDRAAHCERSTERALGALALRIQSASAVRKGSQAEAHYNRRVELRKFHHLTDAPAVWLRRKRPDKSCDWSEVYP